MAHSAGFALDRLPRWRSAPAQRGWWLRLAPSSATAAIPPDPDNSGRVEGHEIAVAPRAGDPPVDVWRRVVDADSWGKEHDPVPP